MLRIIGIEVAKCSQKFVYVQQNADMFNAWALAALEILEKAPREKITGKNLALTAEKFMEFLKPKLVM
jgi:hypothetical protein